MKMCQILGSLLNYSHSPLLDGLILMISQWYSRMWWRCIKIWFIKLFVKNFKFQYENNNWIQAILQQNLEQLHICISQISLRHKLCLIRIQQFIINKQMDFIKTQSNHNQRNKNILSNKNEYQKIKLETQNTLLTVIDLGLRLLHPMMQYLSQELWQKSPFQKEDSLIIAKYPQTNPQWINQNVEIQFDLILNVLKKIRQIISKFELPSNKKPDVYTLNLIRDKSLDDFFKSQTDIMILLARIKSIIIIAQGTEQQKQYGVDTIDAKIKIFVNLKDYIEIAKENVRLFKKLNEFIKLINQWSLRKDELIQ
ncbi:unnamed protein product [Paramecium sonneborni]|uniref:valine--tRNA ligase n=1 Tax=Paramecium sonneborni TaxID=65129 RepID=A0A8S1R3H6_9CILI|nr:unnamed protein product [Paramecium sonneborni]